MEETNGEQNCTVREDSDCVSYTTGCSLHCRWNENILKSFIAAASVPFIGTFIILVLIRLFTGQWWPFVLYIILLLVLFRYEIKFLCSHCPYYAGEGKILKCLANHGMPRHSGITLLQ